MKVCIRIRQDGDRFVATCAMLPGCTSNGSSADEARQRLEEAIRGYLASVANFVPEVIHSVVETVG